MASYMLVRHKVEDFPKWKTTYDAHRPMRDAAGLTELHLFHNEQDKNEVIVLFKAQSLDDAKGFASSEDLRETMQNAGVIDKPDIYFMNE